MDRVMNNTAKAKKILKVIKAAKKCTYHEDCKEPALPGLSADYCAAVVW